MITVNINQFNGYDHKAVYSFLMLQNQNEFEIIIPKIVVELEEDNFSVFFEYHVVAYAGHRLAQIASSFAYNVPSPKKQKPFRFEVEMNDLEKFSDLLYEIIAAYNDIDIDDQVINFQMAASEFFNDAFDNKVEAATWGLLSTANDFLEE